MKIQNLLMLLSESGISKLSDGFCEYLARKITILVALFCRHGGRGLDLVSDRFALTFAQMNADKTKDTNQEAELDLLSEVASQHVTKMSPLDRELWRFIESGGVDCSLIEESAKRYDDGNYVEKLREEIYLEFDRMTYDLSCSEEECCRRIVEILNNNKRFVIGAVSPGNFIYIMQVLKDVSPDAHAISMLECELMENYIDHSIGSVSTYNDYCVFSNDENILFLFGKYGDLKDKFKDKIDRLLKSLVSVEVVLEVLKKIKSQSGWNQEDEDYINSLDKDHIINTVFKNDKLLRLSVDFAKNRRKPGDPFYGFYKSMQKAIEHVGEEGLGRNRYKRIVQLLNGER